MRYPGPNDGLLELVGGVAPSPGTLDGDPADFTLGGGFASGSWLSLVGGGVGGGGGADDKDLESIHALLLLVFGFAVLLVVVLLGGVADVAGRDGGGGTIMPLLDPVIGSAGSKSRSDGW